MRASEAAARLCERDKLPARPLARADLVRRECRTVTQGCERALRFPQSSKSFSNSARAASALILHGPVADAEYPGRFDPPGPTGRRLRVHHPR